MSLWNISVLDKFKQFIYIYIYIHTKVSVDPDTFALVCQRAFIFVWFQM